MRVRRVLLNPDFYHIAKRPGVGRYVQANLACALQGARQQQVDLIYADKGRLRAGIIGLHGQISVRVHFEVAGDRIRCAIPAAKASAEQH